MSGIQELLDEMELINTADTAETTAKVTTKPTAEVTTTETTPEEKDATKGDSDQESSDEDAEDEDVYYQRLDANPSEDGYIVIVNGKPRYYVKTVVEAKDCIWHVARCLVDKLNPNYNISFTMPNRYTVNVERRSRWAIISYDEIVHSVSFQKIKGVKLVEVEEDSSVKKEKTA